MNAVRGITTDALWVAVANWPVTVALFVVGIAAVTLGSPLRSETFRRYAIAVLGTYMFPVLTIIVGVILRYEGRVTGWVYPPRWAAMTLYAIPLLHMIALVTVVSLARGNRMRATSQSLLGMWLSFCATFASVAALTNIGTWQTNASAG
jgi:hypothetical protein